MLSDPEHPRPVVVIPTEHGYAMSTRPGELSHLIKRHGAEVWQGVGTDGDSRLSDDKNRPWM